MEFIKAKLKGKDIYVVFTHSYSFTLAYIHKLFEEARKDFPELTMDDIAIHTIKGDHHNGHLCIKFCAGKNRAVKRKGYSLLDQNSFCTLYSVI